MKVKVTKVSTVEISRCYHQCPYFSVEGGPGPIMICNHPEVENPHIITHPKCVSGFPEKCPLLKERELDYKI